MRQIGTLPSEHDAKRFADYLLTLRITTHLEREPDGWAVWVRDEDNVPRGKEELEAFLRNPHDSRYDAARQAAAAIRQQEEQAEKQYRRRHREMRGYWDRPLWQRFPLTAALMGASIVVSLLYWFAPDPKAVFARFAIVPFAEPDGQWSPLSLHATLQRAPWRLVTPIFVHFDPLHLLFNMYMLIHLGGMVESRRGPLRYAVLVLVAAGASNLAQYLLDWPPIFRSGPVFGGMSGVVYALFGYVWMKARYDPEAGLFLWPTTVLFLMVWLFLGMTNWIGSIANTAHAAGLVVGVVFGVASSYWRKLL
jgi:GlpG protein